jgi:hypothetical protein
MKPPFDKWDVTDAERILADAMVHHRARALAEARSLDAATVGTNRVPPVNRHGRSPGRQRFADAFPSWNAFVAAVRSDADPGAVELALQLLSLVAPDEVLPVVQKILAVSPWNEMGSAVGHALGRVDDTAAVKLALAHADVPYVMDGVASSICARAWPIVLARLKGSRVMNTSRAHPRSETYVIESVIAYFGNHHVEAAWPVLSRLYAESIDEYVLLASGHVLIAWGDERSLVLLKKDIGSRSARRRFFAVRAHLYDGESQAMDALGGLEALGRPSGRVLADELMEQVWHRARDAKKATGGRGGIADKRYLDLALTWVKDKRMIGICRYVLDCWDKRQVAAAKKRLLESGKVKKPAPPPKLAASDVAAMRRSMKKARKNLERIVVELEKLGYAFDAKTPLGKPASLKTVSAIEKAIGGPLPVSLRMALLEIGSCDLTGTFPGHEASLETDAFVLGNASEILEDALENAGGEARWPLAFAPDAVGKAGFSGGQETILVPDESLDAPVEGVKGKPLMLDRLRQVFRYGGFPGLAGKKGQLRAVAKRLAKVCTAI